MRGVGYLVIGASFVLLGAGAAHPTFFGTLSVPGGLFEGEDI